MKVSQRLFLGVLPSVIGLGTVAGLAYWGQYAHTAPGLFVVTAALATLASLVVAWRNTRYVARRVERLASMRAASHAIDELDVIENTVESLDAVASKATADARSAREGARLREEEYAKLIADASASISTQLAEARLSLHVLQENHFGELNDNQDEMIAAARQGVENAERELGNLRAIADIDRGAFAIGNQRVKPGEIIRSLIPLLKSRGAKKNVRVLAEIEPGLPRVHGDRAKLQDAFGLVLNDAVTYAVPGTSLSIHVMGDQTGVSVVVNHGAPHSSNADLMLSQRLVSAHGGSVRSEGDATLITLPA